MPRGEATLAFDPQRLRALVGQVAEFRIRDRNLVAEQRAIETVIASRQPTEEEVRRYLRAVERYFTGFAREAERALKDVDRRLAQINQVQFNLQAERGVALRRVEVTQGVLSGVRELG